MTICGRCGKEPLAWVFDADLMLSYCTICGTYYLPKRNRKAVEPKRPQLV